MSRSRCRGRTGSSCGQLLGLRDRARELLAAEAASLEDTPRARRSFAPRCVTATAPTRHGTGRSTASRCAGPAGRTRRAGRSGWPGSPRPRCGCLRRDPFAPLVAALEVFDDELADRDAGGDAVRAGDRAARAATRRRHRRRTRSRSAWTPTAASTSRRSPACSAPTRRRARAARRARLPRPRPRPARPGRRVPLGQRPRQARRSPARARARPALRSTSTRSSGCCRRT